MTKAQLVEQYLNLSSGIDMQGIRAALLAEFERHGIMLTEAQVRRVHKFLDLEIVAARKMLEPLVTEALDESDLAYLIERNNHPAVKKSNELLPKLMPAIMDRIQKTQARVEEIMLAPEKIESLPS